MIDELPESLLLVEIFMRLRNPRYIMACKSVSKRWNSLISSFFDDHRWSSLALIVNTDPLCTTNELSLEGWKGFQLSNYMDPEIKSPVCVLASYRDVLLCKKFKESRFYIVNPVTMQWTRLPETCGRLSPIGLTGNGSKGRYYVVNLVRSEPCLLCLSVLDTKRGKWRIRLIEHPRWSEFGWCPTQCHAVNFEGALHWLGQNGPIVAYNPKYRHACIVIHRFPEMRHESYGEKAVVTETLTISMGYLRVIQLVCYPCKSEKDHHLVIWTLVDYKKSIWKQEEHGPIYFSDMVSDLSWIQDYMQRYNLTTSKENCMALIKEVFLLPRETRRQQIIWPQPLHCHPDNPLLVYLYLPESIVLLDITTKKLRLITKVATRTRRMGYHFYWTRYDKVIPLTLHLDPSLIPDTIGR